MGMIKDRLKEFKNGLKEFKDMSVLILKLKWEEGTEEGERMKNAHAKYVKKKVKKLRK